MSLCCAFPHPHASHLSLVFEREGGSIRSPSRSGSLNHLSRSHHPHFRDDTMLVNALYVHTYPYMLFDPSVCHASWHDLSCLLMPASKRRWGEPVLLFLACVKQHTRDRGLDSEAGYYNGEAWGGAEARNWDTGQRLVQHKDPHPAYLGGRSPNYWVTHILPPLALVHFGQDTRSCGYEYELAATET